MGYTNLTCKCKGNINRTFPTASFRIPSITKRCTERTIKQQDNFIHTYYHKITFEGNTYAISNLTNAIKS